MSEWSGFTEADLKRMRQMSENPGPGPKIVKPVTGGRSKVSASQGSKSQRKPNTKPVKRATSKEYGNVPAGAMLSKPVTKPSQESVTLLPTNSNEQMPLHGKSSPTPVAGTEISSDTQPEPKEPEILEDMEAIKEKEKLKLEDIQRRQKEMEEKNKRKKTMLSKAIAERKKKAFAESNRLIQIQSELAKLDEMLNYDVSIVRDKIDAACHDYNAAQKRFEKAETEYIESKINLHRATEMKEDLTEHLYKLIQLNEERKANKLEELMKKLELEETEDAKQPSSESVHQEPNPEIIVPVNTSPEVAPEEKQITSSKVATEDNTKENVSDPDKSVQ